MHVAGVRWPRRKWRFVLLNYSPPKIMKHSNYFLGRKLHALSCACFLCNLSCSTFFAFLRRYHANQVIMKIGRTSAPGTSSNKLIIPIQRKIKRQATIPTISSISPITGIIKLAAMYSLMSNSRHNMRENNSTPLKMKYSGTGLNSLFNSYKPLSCVSLMSLILIGALRNHKSTHAFSLRKMRSLRVVSPFCGV